MKTPIGISRCKWDDTVPECGHNFRSLTLTKLSFCDTMSINHSLLLICNLLRLVKAMTANNAGVVISVSNGFMFRHIATLYRDIPD
jgi:hypothetical protein